jgi:hypothetical protein
MQFMSSLLSPFFPFPISIACKYHTFELDRSICIILIRRKMESPCERQEDGIYFLLVCLLQSEYVRVSFSPLVQGDVRRAQKHNWILLGIKLFYLLLLWWYTYWDEMCSEEENFRPCCCSVPLAQRSSKRVESICPSILCFTGWNNLRDEQNRLVDFLQEKNSCFPLEFADLAKMNQSIFLSCYM